jgi:hypothetical protein
MNKAAGSGESEGKPINKFVVGVASSVVAAVIGFFLIGPGGLLNREKEKSPGEARITAFNGPNYSSVGQVPRRTFTVYNGGEKAAEKCVIFWNPFGPDTDVPDSILSGEFTLTPGQTKDITLQANQAYGQAAIFDEGASVFCETGDYHSPTVKRVVNTYGLGG